MVASQPDMHGPDSGGPAVDLKSWTDRARSPELSSEPGHFRPVVYPTKAVSKRFLETIQYNAEFHWTLLI